MAVLKPVGKLTSEYLGRCGYSAQDIASWNEGTRLLHDLGLCGDDIHDDFKVLRQYFGVDLSQFEFSRYFPSELSTDALVISVRRLLYAAGLRKVVDGVASKYQEVTLGMIEDAIAKRKWK